MPKQVRCHKCDWIGSIGDAVLGSAINAHKILRGLLPNKTQPTIAESGKLHCCKCYRPICFVENKKL